MLEKEAFITNLKGISARARLNDLNVHLAIIQAAYLLCLEGVSRATANQILQRAVSEFSLNLTASEAGTILIGFSLRKVTIHGKSRFILNQGELKELRFRIEQQLKENEDKLESAIKYFSSLSAEIQELQNRWKNIQEMFSRKNDLIKLINNNQSSVANFPALQAQWKLLQDTNQKMVQIENECKDLNNQIKKLPSLEQRKTQLVEAVKKYQVDEKQLVEKEARMGRVLTDLKERNAWVDYVTLALNIQNAKAELDELSRQLGEKRSLLDKLLGRNKGVA
jgi:DNA repair ATPase RecN